MTEPRKVRTSDWFNGVIGGIMLSFASWAGCKLVYVGDVGAGSAGKIFILPLQA